MSWIERVRPHSSQASPLELKRWRKHLSNQRNALLDALSQDTGRSATEAFLVEWSAIESALDFLESELDGVIQPKVQRSSLKKVLGLRRVVARRLPLGKVLVLGTWNFPGALHVVQILFARAMGNQVCFKPSPLTPAFSKWCEETFSILWGDQFELFSGTEIDVQRRILDREFQLVLFTGGTGGARALSRICGEAMVPFLPEASGSESAVVLNEPRSAEDIDALTDHLLWGAFHHAGQTCVAPRFWFVPESQAADFFQTAKRLMVENPQSALSRAPLKTEAVRTEHQKWKSWLESQGCETFSLPERSEFFVGFQASVAKLGVDSPATFGPGVVVVGYQDLHQAVDWIRQSPWSLMTCFFGKADPKSAEVLQLLDASLVSVNECVASVGDAAIPFGGRSLSGFGVTHGVEGLMQMSRSQSWVEVQRWPGLNWIQPSWKRIRELNDLGGVLKEFDEGPLVAAKRLVSNWRQS